MRIHNFVRALYITDHFMNLVVGVCVVVVVDWSIQNGVWHAYALW